MKFWYAILAGGALAAIIHVSFPNKTYAQQQQQSTYYTDRWGSPAGQAWTLGNQTFYTNAIGAPLGSAMTTGNQSPAPLPLPYPEPLRIEPIRPIEPIQPLRMQ